MHGLFIPGSEYYTKTTYPSYDPSGAANLVKQVQQQTGKPAHLHRSIPPATPKPCRQPSSYSRRSRRPGMKVNINILAQSTIINDALAGTYQATLWRQFGAVDPDLNYVWWTTQLASGSLALNMARNVDPRIQAALVSGRTTDEKASRVKDYQQINEYLAQDIPYLWLARDTWAVIANPKVQNFANPTTLQSSKAVAFDEGVLWPAQIWLS